MKCGIKKNKMKKTRRRRRLAPIRFDVSNHHE
jgi:hypothetical protein